ncbi:DNA-binding protein [Actinomadura spongiicola]|uniref:DNA-binding protein n=2 Tax=Actinomadura spongiicola TaxID=2303421 RepID=A0A372GCQ2_9ACTN|nr:DNA-binding protein [Actinomadura spongiicola]
MSHAGDRAGRDRAVPGAFRSTFEETHVPLSRSVQSDFTSPRRVGAAVGERRRAGVVPPLPVAAAPPPGRARRPRGQDRRRAGSAAVGPGGEGVGHPHPTVAVRRGRRPGRTAAHPVGLGGRLPGGTFITAPPSPGPVRADTGGHRRLARPASRWTPRLRRRRRLRPRDPRPAPSSTFEQPHRGTPPPHRGMPGLRPDDRLARPARRRGALRRLRLDVHRPPPQEGVMTDLTRTFLSVPQAAERVGMGVPAIRQWISRGHLPVVRIGRRVFIRELDLLIAERDTRRRGGKRRPSPPTD